MNTFYVTTPIYYANSLPHLGHLYTMIVADTIARAKRQRGIETYFLTGTDEHGINIERAAEKPDARRKNKPITSSVTYKKMTSEFGLDTEHGGYDIFMRTTEPFHYEGVSELWRRVAKRKPQRATTRFTRATTKAGFALRALSTRPKTSIRNRRTEGDPPTCLIHDTPLDRVSEESYFFRLSDYDEALLVGIMSPPEFVRPESRRNEVMSFVRGGLQDLSVSRLKTSGELGRARAGRSGAHDVRLVRRADQLHHRDRLRK